MIMLTHFKYGHEQHDVQLLFQMTNKNRQKIGSKFLTITHSDFPYCYTRNRIIWVISLANVIFWLHNRQTCDQPVDTRYCERQVEKILIDRWQNWWTTNRLFALIIKLWEQFHDHTIKSTGLDNAGEFTFHTFDDYCMSLGISVEHSIAHVHTQSGLKESLNMRIHLISRPLVRTIMFPTSVWGHKTLLVTTLTCNRLNSYNYHIHATIAPFIFLLRHLKEEIWDHKEVWGFCLLSKAVYY